jgi:leucyl aminopeptidase
MKNDMAGGSTVYGAFRAAVLSNSPNKLTCIIPMTDNVVSGAALLPDSVIVGRSGKTVEIRNTDAEGRLILADALDYTCDLKVDAIIDVATLTGAAVRSLGTEVCACFGNKPTLIGELMKSTSQEGEYLWEMPMIDEWKKDFDSTVADMTNAASKPLAGSSKAAIFLREFIKKGIPWVHLDIAGVACSQPGRPYCPSKGASGLMIRPLVNFIMKK